MPRNHLRFNIRRYIKDLRARALVEGKHQFHPSQLDHIVFTEARQGYLDGQSVPRLVIFLRGTGCSWIEQTGGCTFCGFWNATNFGTKISDEAYMQQLINTVQDLNVQFDRFPIVCLYNDGSMLAEEEISLNAVVEMCALLSQRDHIKKLVIEAKVIDISEEKVSKLMEVIHPKAFEIAVGFESIDGIIQDLCINKMFNVGEFEAACDISKRYGVSLVPLIMVKPPFLNELQAIEDVVKSLKYLEQFDLQRIDLELATVEENTLMYDLWHVGLYSPSRLWSIIEILKRKSELHLKTPIYLSPPNYTVKAYDRSLNCPECTPAIIDKMDEYNRNGKSSIFDSIECSCKAEWQELLKKDTGSEMLLNQIGKKFQELVQRKNDLVKEGKHEN